MSTWNVDPSHTEVGFAVRHMGLSTVRGRFADVSGTIEPTPMVSLQQLPFR